MEYWPEDWLKEQCSVFGVIDDVVDLINRQTWIYRMPHQSSAGASILQFEMPVRIHCQSSNAIKSLKSEIY